jgi:hypothetical protein
MRLEYNMDGGIDTVSPDRLLPAEIAVELLHRSRSSARYFCSGFVVDNQHSQETVEE